MPHFPTLTAGKERVPLLKIEEPPTAAGRIAEFFTDLLTWRPLAQASHNFLHGLHFHKDYFQHPHFSTWKGICFSPPGPCSLESSQGHLSLRSLIQTPTLCNPWSPSPLSSVPWAAWSRSPFFSPCDGDQGPASGPQEVEVLLQQEGAGPEGRVSFHQQRGAGISPEGLVPSAPLRAASPPHPPNLSSHQTGRVPQSADTCRALPLSTGCRLPYQHQLPAPPAAHTGRGSHPVTGLQPPWSLSGGMGAGLEGGQPLAWPGLGWPISGLLSLGRCALESSIGPTFPGDCDSDTMTTGD